MENVALLLNPVTFLQFEHFHVLGYRNFLVTKL